MQLGRRSRLLSLRGVITTLAAIALSLVVGVLNGSASAPSAPLNVVATAGANQASVSWSPPSDNGGATITAYRVTAVNGSTARESTWVPASTSNATLTGLSGGLSYTLQVSAFNGILGVAGVSNAVSPTGPSTTYASTVLADGAMAYYRFDDTFGTLADSSGNGRDGSYVGNYSQAQSGALPNDSDGSTAMNANGWASVPGATWMPLGASARTLEVWFRTTAWVGSGGFLLAGYGSQNCANNGFGVYLNNATQVFVEAGCSTFGAYANYALNNGAWHLLDATYDGSTITVYVDGSQIGSGGGYSWNTTAADLTWDAGGLGATVYYDEGALYPSALSGTQVLNHFNLSGNLRPTVPGSVTATPGTNQATVSWTPSTGSPGYGVSAYRVSASNGQATYVGSSATQATLTGLAAGSYTFNVQALDNFGLSASGTSSAASVTGASSTYASSVLGDGAIAYYRLDDSTGLMADSTNNQRDGQYGCNFICYTLGQGSAIANDTDASALLGQNGSFGGYFWPLGNSNRSFEFWFHASSTGGQQLLGYGSAGCGNTGFDVNLASSTQIQVQAGCSNPAFNSPYSLTTGSWHQVVVTYTQSTNTVALYLDGSSLGATGVSAWNTVDSVLQIFGNSGVAYGFDDVSAYATVLSAAQVLAHFNAAGYHVPSAPQNVSASAGANQATVTWSPPTDGGGSPISAYKVTAYNGAAAAGSMYLGSSARSATLSGLQGSVSYSLKVQAVNGFGLGTAGASNAVSPTGAVTTYLSTVLGDGALGYYRMDDSTNLMADATGHGHDGSYGCNGACYTLGQGGALPNDSDAAVLLGQANTSSGDWLPLGAAPRSVEFWFHSNSAGYQLFGYGNTNCANNGFDVVLSSTNQVQVQAGCSTATFTASRGLTDGIWHQLAVTYDGANVAAYIDGSSVGSQSVGSWNTTATPLQWFGNSGVAAGFDDGSVYGSVLSAGQVQNHFTAAGYHAPGAPTDVRVTAQAGSALVTWNAPSDLGGPLASSYVVTPYVGTTAGTSTTVSSKLTSAKIDGLTGGTSYTFKVTAANSYFTGSPSAASSTVTPGSPLPSPVPAASLIVSLAYADNFDTNSNFTPSIWNGSPNTTFVGDSGPYDAGAVMLSNPSTAPVAVSDVTVDVGGTLYDLWGSSLTVPARGNLILTQTSGCCGFDTTDAIGSSCNSTVVPVVHVTVGGATSDYPDTAKVLTMYGANPDSCGGTEGLQWQIAGGGGFLPMFLGPDGSLMVCWNCMGDPVNTATGGLSESFNDFSIPGRGIALNLSRTYDSLGAGTDGPFGFGWASSYGMSLTQANGGVTVNQEGGSSVSFTPSPSGYTTNSRVLASLTLNPDGTFTFERPDQIRYVFSSRGWLIKEIDRNGYVTTLGYNGSDQLATITDPGGRALTINWTGSHISSITDTVSRGVSYFYDGNGNLDHVIDVGGGTTQFGYDSNHLMTLFKDPKCQATTGCAGVVNVFDGSGRVTRQTDSLGRVTTFSYAPGQTTITDPRGNVTIDNYNSNLQLTSETRGSGTSSAVTTFYQYDSVSGGMTQIKDGNNHLWNYTYDANGNKLSAQDPIHPATAYTYNSFNEVATSTDPNGVMTSYGYDANGNLTSKSTPIAGSSPPQSVVYQYFYDDAGHPGDVTRMIDPDGNTWTYSYNANGDLASVTNQALSQETQYFFDGVGRMTCKVLPKATPVASCPAAGSAHVISYGTNAFGDTISVTDADSTPNSTSYLYDANRNQIQMTDPDGNVTKYTYDFNNEQTIIENGFGSAQDRKTWTVYDGDGNVSKEYDGLSRLVFDASMTAGSAILNSASGTFTSADQGVSVIVIGAGTSGADLTTTVKTVTSSTRVTLNASATTTVSNATASFGNLPTRYVYDPLNRTSSSTDPLSRVTNYTYDSASNLKTLKDAKNNTTTYGYDSANELGSITYSDGVTPNVTSIQYDNDGQRLSMADGTGTSSYSWDSVHRLTQSQDGAGNVVKYGYDLRGDVASITYPGGSCTSTPTTLCVTRHFDAAGRLDWVQDWLGNRTTFGYDSDSNLTMITYPNGVVATITPDNADNVTSIVDAKGGTQLLNLSYTRDHLAQLKTENSTSFGYDAINRVTSGGSISYAYDAADRLSQVVSSGTTSTYAYDAADQLSSKTTGNRRVTYSYDANGNRTGESDIHNSYGYDQANRLTSFGTTDTYAYNGDGLRMKKTISGSAEAFVWDVAEGLPLLLKDGSTSYVTGPGGLPLEQVTSSNTVYYYSQDQLGSTRLTTDALGAVADTYTFDAYGNVTASTGAVSNPLKFGGQYQDSETGFYYLRNRYYDPSTGQFVSRDPLAGTSTEPYSYVSDRPLNMTDASGHMGVVLCAALEIPIVGEGACAVGVVVTVVEVASAVVAGGGLAALAAQPNSGAIPSPCPSYQFAKGEDPNLKGRDALRQENAIAERAARNAGLNREGQRALHDAISGQGYTPGEIQEIADDLAANYPKLRQDQGSQGQSSEDEVPHEGE